MKVNIFCVYLYMEIWKPIKNYETSYAVSNTGKVKNIITGRILKAYVRDKNSKIKQYLCVQLYAEGKRWIISVHVLVYDTFKRKPRKGYHIDHKDNDPWNNHIDNLQLIRPRHNFTKDKDYPGIYHVKKTDRWIARIQIKGKMTYLGIRKNKEEAFALYKAAFEKIEGSPL